MASFTMLNNGEKIPTVGFGTSRIAAEQLEDCVVQALDAGYRHIDTAILYQNEHIIGNALKRYIKTGRLKREDIFLTSKLTNAYLEPDNVLPALEDSLRCLQLDYLDLFLVHSPMAVEKPQGNQSLSSEDVVKLKPISVDLLDTWKAMENLVTLGKVKSIGVSNFNSLQVETICNGATILPVINQVEINAQFQQVELQKFCDRYNVKLTAFAPLGSPARGIVETHKPDPLFQERIILEIARSYSKTPAQILLRNLVQRGLIVIPKTSNFQRMKENIDLFNFSLKEEDMLKIATLNTNQRQFLYIPEALYRICRLTRHVYQREL